jgi:hypothetical protein
LPLARRFDRSDLGDRKGKSTKSEAKWAAPPAVSQKLPTSASFALEVDHYSCAQIPGIEQFLTETGA